MYWKCSTLLLVESRFLSSVIWMVRIVLNLSVGVVPVDKIDFNTTIGITQIQVNYMVGCGDRMPYPGWCGLDSVQDVLECFCHISSVLDLTHVASQLDWNHCRGCTDACSHKHLVLEVVLDGQCDVIRVAFDVSSDFAILELEY